MVRVSGARESGNIVFIDLIFNGWSRLNNDPPESHILVLEPVNISFYGKRVMEEMMFLGILRWDDYSGLCRYILHVTHEFLQEGGRGRSNIDKTGCDSGSKRLQ